MTITYHNIQVWFGLLWFALLWCATVCFLQHEGKLDWDLLFNADYERLQTSMPEAGIEPADYSTKWKCHTIQPSPDP